MVVVHLFCTVVRVEIGQKLGRLQYFTPKSPERVGVSRLITPDHALITPFWGREHAKVAPIVNESTYSVIL